MQTILGVFDDRTTAERAVTRLTETGFDRSEVHLESNGAAGATGPSSVETASTIRTDAHGNAYAGGGDADGKGVMGSIGDFFSSLFGSDGDDHPHRAHSERYSEAVRRGSYVVVVDARDEDDAERAADLMQELGAVDIDERAEQWRSSGWTGGSYNNSATPPTGQQMFTGGASAQPQVARLEQPGTTGTGMTHGVDSSADRLGAEASLQGERKLDVVQEELQVGKRAVQRGGVRVVQRISEKPVSEVVRLREEHAVVQRRNVDRDATVGDLGMGKDVVVEVRETVEEPVVAKRAHVVEEVVVGTEVRERDETINDTVRRKDVDVERLADSGSGAGQRNLEHAEARREEPGLTGTRRADDGLNVGREPKDLPERRNN
jgi:uncharacterized protein (TIGR02271 family)